MKKNICPWANESPLELEYHNNQWGVPLHNDQKIFEMLILETMQSGLSWKTILSKRTNLNNSYDNFCPQMIQKYDKKKIESLLMDKSIIRNSLKIKATISNAKAFLNIVDDFGSFDTFIWSYVNNVPIQTNRVNVASIPKFTPIAEEISKDLKLKGFKFLGPTTVYSFMQSIGMINDHIVSCPMHKKCLNLSK